MSKYEPLREHLAKMDDVVWAAKLNEIETILGTSLPKSARQHRTWWANSGRSLVHQNAWLEAGWRVERTDLMRDVIVFRRLRIGGTSVVEKGNRRKLLERNAKSVAEKRLIKEMQPLRQPLTVTLRSEWSSLGEVHNTPCSNPAIPHDGGVVRFACLKDEGLMTTIIAAESVQQVYRALRSVLTDTEVAEKLKACGSELCRLSGISAADPVECDIVRPGNAWLLTDGRGRKANFAEESERNLIAQLVYLQEIQAGRKSSLILR